MSETSLTLLTNSFMDEVVRAMGLSGNPAVKSIVRRVFGKAVSKFSNTALQVDEIVARHGAMAGARHLLQHFASGYVANGMELIPKEGPLIIASNHPASYDGMVISACVSRDDYKIIIGEIPPYRYLPNISRHVILSPQPPNIHGRMLAARRVIQHLKAGGSLLIFPRGGIEPDPAFMPEPGAEFHLWSRSLEFFLKNVPETRVLVTSVSGVIAKKIFHHPITWLRTKRPDKQRLTFIYQIIRQVWSGRELFGLRPRITFGELLGSKERRVNLQDIEFAAHRTLARHMQYLQANQGDHHAFAE